MTPDLPAKYEQVCKMLADLVKVDEVKAIRDKARAMEVYARQAKDTALIDHATDIRMRAERRAGELLAEMAKRKERQKPGDNPRGVNSRTARPLTPKLADLGVTKSQSSRWQRLADLDEVAFESKVSDAKRIAVASVEGNREIIHAARKAQQDVKRARRAEREQELGAKIIALPEKKYGVILADPEWRFEPWSRETGLDRAADNHYPTSCTEVIAARDVPSIAAKDCALFQCATAPMLLHAAVVMAAWGFTYVTNWELHKDRVITGYWNRNRHEHLLLGIRGNVPCPAPGEQWESVIEMTVGRHSAKPDAIYQMIEAYFPNVPKIELNRRGAARPGWDAWGNEVAGEAAE